MATKNHISNAERFGGWLGRVRRGYTCRNGQAKGWLQAQGVPAGGAAVLLWIVKLSALVILSYIALWLALLLLFAAIAAWAAHSVTAEDDGQKPEWRMGLSGYGLYRGDVRIDPGSTDDDY